MKGTPPPAAAECGMSRASLAAPIWLMLCAAGGMMLGHQLAERPFLGLVAGALAGNIPILLLGAGDAVMNALHTVRPAASCRAAVRPGGRSRPAAGSGRS